MLTFAYIQNSFLRILSTSFIFSFMTDEVKKMDPFHSSNYVIKVYFPYMYLEVWFVRNTLRNVITVNND